ncbi:hypothetical protein [Sulfurisphaera javensis]|uniref:hypothetical protein n=1 Tax=Sulfurisphaera javensis TaxID=2049879 RepID=UPI0034E886BD
MATINIKGQSTLIAFLLALLLIALILIPTYYLLLSYSKPSVKVSNFALIAKNQINGGSVSIFYYDAPGKDKGNITLLLFSGNGNFTLTSVYTIYNGSIINITKEVEAIIIKPTGNVPIGTLPQPLIYNFTTESTISTTINNRNVLISVWQSILILQIEAYNQTIFVTLYPNETALS